ncbi:UNVERIFIED_ORG: alkylation response protein AidB-like acyl-CoA dehydrogenase [Burkholderia sp. CF145]
MEFALSQDQLMLTESLRRALDGESTLERVRETVDQAQPMNAEVWRTLCDLGIPALLVPEAHGGLGLTLLDAAIVSEQLGRAVAPVPFLGSTVLAPLALREAGSAAQQAEWLPRIAAGEKLVGVAFTEALSGSRDGAGVRYEHGQLCGTVLFVIDGAQADAWLVADPAGTMYLVDAKTAGLRRKLQCAADGTRPTVELHLENVEAQTLPGANVSTLARLRDAAWIMLAADALGAGWRMLDKAVAYSKERSQFGRLIGTFQAVKHMCAEMAAELEPGRSLVWYAAHAFDALPEDAPLYAAHAKAVVCDAARFVARTAIEVHGGIGITDELGLHYWYKRIAFDRALYGTPERVRRHAASLQGLTQAA